MAVFKKYWPNGDALTLTTGVGGISVESDPNLTGNDRSTTFQVRTTNSGVKVTKTVTVEQSRYTIPQDGYWVHKTTDVKTYFGADASFISSGLMSRPSWIGDAKEIKLCSGITGFASKTASSGGTTIEYYDTFWETSIDPFSGYPKNSVLDILDMSLSAITSIPESLIVAYDVNPVTYEYILTDFQLLALPISLEEIGGIGIAIASNNNPSIIISESLEKIGGEGHGSPIMGINNEGDLLTIKTPFSNVSNLTNLISSENAAGRGIYGNYQIIGI